MKKYTFISIICLIAIIGFFTGVYLYKINNLNKNIEIGYNGEKIEDECTQITELAKLGELDTLLASRIEEKVSPKCILTIKKLYTDCNHILQTSEEISDKFTNLNEEEFKKEYPDWEVQKFTSGEIVLYKEINDFCDEHYRLKDLDGNIAIYELDKNGNETKLLEVTDILTQYLTETDLIELENGMNIYTKQELNKAIEDFE